MGVEVVDLAAVAVFDYAAAEFHGGGESVVVGGEFVRYEENTFQLFETGEILIGLFHDAFVESLDFGMGYEFCARGKSDVVVAGLGFEQGEVRRDDDASKFSFVANDGRGSNQRAELQGVLEGLRSDELSP